MKFNDKNITPVLMVNTIDRNCCAKYKPDRFIFLRYSDFSRFGFP